MQPRTRRLLLLVILIAGLLYFLLPSARKPQQTLSLLPSPLRMIGIRFDPSFFYNRGLTALELAREEVERWAEAGVNTVFFRVYDPRYGASYRTDHPYNVQTDYGRQDLLGYVLKQAHKRGIKVIAWLPVLNHLGLWKAKPAWRALRQNGEPYTAPGMPAPLCPRHPGVRQWWLGFVGDLLQHYPELDGIDLAEPLISWREGEACYCDLCRTGFANGGALASGDWKSYRAAPLTSLLQETIKQIRALGKTVVLTAVLPVDARGGLLSFEVLRDRTGLDLEALLSGSLRPDYLSVELMWQQWASVFKDRDTFNPGWVRNALREARRMAAGRSRVIAHLEATDFDGVVVTAPELAEAVKTALTAGACGIDIYAASLIEKKKAWGIFKGLERVEAVKRVLVLHDPEVASDAWQIATLCGHFSTTVSVEPVLGYRKGTLGRYDAGFYVGDDDSLKLPEAFLADVQSAAVPFAWLNANIAELLSRTSKFGFILVGSRDDPSFNTVRYKGIDLPRNEPHLNVINITDPKKVEVLARVRSPEEALPYAIQAGLLWYFADNPLSYAVEGGRYLVFADLLHDLLGEDHLHKKTALVRIEDVHPLTPPESLRRIAHLLQERGIPFLVSVIPFYVFPEKGLFIPMSERPEFVSALKEMVACGGTVVLHGVTHQRTGESAADYEFWDPQAGGPPADRSDAKTRARILAGLEECARNGIFPLIWETPHYAAPGADYRVAASIFRAACERRQSADKIGTDQLYPYSIRKDRWGQILLPENLGYVPLDDQRPDPIVQAAIRTAVVRDCTAGFFFHPFCKSEVLAQIVDSLLEEGFAFPDPKTVGLEVRARGLYLARTHLPLPEKPAGVRALLLSESGKVLWQGPPEKFPRNGDARRGIAVFFEREPRRESRFALRRGGGGGFLMRALQVGIVCPAEEFEELAQPFRAVSAPCERIDPAAEVAQLGEGKTMLVVPERTAAGASATLRSRLLVFMRRGGVLFTWGRSGLCEELGFKVKRETRSVEEVEDLNYPGTKITLKPPMEAPVLSPPPGVEVLARAKVSKIPLLATMGVDDGFFLYAAIRPFSTYGATPFPYIMSVIEAYCLHSPLSRSKRLEVYFDPGLRENVAVEDLVKLWSSGAVRVIHVGAWHEYPEWTYEYDRLIELAHQNGMLVYAWFVLPMVSPKFWQDHPEWREKNIKGEDLDIEWRKAVALLDPACRKAVKVWINNFLDRFDFDGVNLAGLYFGGGGPEAPQKLGPFDQAAISDFKKHKGFDPREIWNPESPHYWRTNATDLADWQKWRCNWVTELHREFLQLFEKHPGLSVTVTTIDGLAKPKAARTAGVDIESLLELRKEIPFRLQLMDAGPARPWGRERVAAILRDYSALVEPEALCLQIDLSRPLDFLPTARLTGVPLYTFLANASPLRVAIYSEDSITDADWPFLARALAAYAYTWAGSEEISVRTAQPVRLSVAVNPTQQVLLDGAPWFAHGSQEIILPPGEHKLKLGRPSAEGDRTPRVVDSSCAVLETEALARGMRFSYRSPERAWVVVNKKALEVRLDGGQGPAAGERGLRGYPLGLPGGSHTVEVIVEGRLSFAFRILSVMLSSGIVAVAVLSLLIVGALFLWAHLSGRRGASRFSTGGEGKK